MLARTPQLPPALERIATRRRLWQPSGPAGFDTAGFAHAQTVYANVDGTHMVSQYDVACYQLSH